MDFTLLMLTLSQIEKDIRRLKNTFSKFQDPKRAKIKKEKFQREASMKLSQSTLIKLDIMELYTNTK